MGKKGIETGVGLFVLLGLGALLFVALKAANLTSFGRADSYTVSARFDNIGGLKPRAAVKRPFTPWRQTSGPTIRRSITPITSTELITNSL